MKKTSLFLIIIICISFFNGYTGKASEIWNSGYINTDSYGAYTKQYGDADAFQPEFSVNAEDYSELSDMSMLIVDENGRRFVRFDKTDSYARFRFHVDSDGLYNISLRYLPIEMRGKPIEIAFKIDGAFSFDGTDRIRLTRCYRDKSEDGKFTQNLNGDELSPGYQEVFEWREEYLSDPDGLYAEPYWFFFSQGEHVIDIQLNDEAFELSDISFLSKRQASEVKYPAHESLFIKYQAEKIHQKGDTALRSLSDKSSPKTEPFDYSRNMINILGGEAWNTPGQWVEWVIEVPQDGEYKLGFKYLQNYIRGLRVSRKLKIDDVPVPGTLRFSYNTDFSVLETKPLFLSEGKHILSMEPVLEDVSNLIAGLGTTRDFLSDMYRKIIMVTGTNPDVNRDYDIKNDIPELLVVLKDCADQLRRAGKELEGEKLNGTSSSQIVFKYSEQLESLVKAPNTIPSRLLKYKENLSGLSAFILSLTQQPLALDYFYIASPDMAAPHVKTNLFQKIYAEFRMFLFSFSKDYRLSVQSSLEVWVGSARDQMNIIKALAEENFHTKTGIYPNIQLVPGTLIQAIMAGQGPDVAISALRSEPVNLALRGAVLPLEEQKGYKKIISEFVPQASLPYRVGEHCYALPETQIFDMMFCRTDIFKELGLSPPNTWEELYNIAPVIQRANMEVGLPYTSGISNIFSTLLLQKGGSFYNARGTRLEINGKIGYQAFSEWVDFYRNLGFPLYKEDYNRFRTGEMPLTIMPYTFYNQLIAAAPEIKGLWSMFPIPGTKSENGNIIRTEAGQGTAAMIMKDAKNKNQAWEFLKWWVSAETQSLFGNEMEALLGTAARYPTANRLAAQKLKWTNKELAILNEQWQSVTEIPEVAGGYYVPRNIDNAFRAAIFRDEDPRELLNYWTEESNKEIKRKLKEFAIEEEEQ